MQKREILTPFSLSEDTNLTAKQSLCKEEKETAFSSF